MAGGARSRLASIRTRPHEFADDPARAGDVVREQFAATPAARAVGEIGLDYHYDFSPRDVQQAVFRAQVRLARELDLPVVIHTREADDDTVAILREEGGGEVRGVLALLHRHAGAGARRRSTSGFYISLAGIVTFPKAGGPARDRPRACRSTGCWSRPTARFWRRAAPRASATSRRASRGWSAALAELYGIGRRRELSPRRTQRPTSTRLFRP